MDEAWSRLPLQLRARFRAHTRRLFDDIYADVRSHAYEHRLTDSSVRVEGEDGKLQSMDLESYVPSLVRAIRNSSTALSKC